MDKMIQRNKFWLFVAFLATVAVVSYGSTNLTINRLSYDQSAVNQQQNSNQQKESAIVIDKFSLFPKREQTTIPSTTIGTTTVESSDVEQNQNKFVQVLRVIDGDTIVAEINGLPVHIRLIGINSPELNDKRTQVACLARKAKEEAERLLDGQKIELEKDPTQGDYDKYSRLLAYIFLSNGSTSLPSAQLGTGSTGGVNFNKLMIEDGYAYEYTYHLPYKYQKEFKTAQDEARNAQKGLWNSDVCRN